jgi:hypothetical protein
MKKRPILFAVIILMFSALACNFLGGGDETDEATAVVEEASDSSSSTGEDSEPSADAAEAQESEDIGPEDDAELTPVVEDEEPDAPAVEPTLAPTAVPTVVPTEAPEQGESDGSGSETGDDQDQVSEGGGSVSAGDGWGESGSGAQTACDHPYLPLRTGSTWTYSGSEGEQVWEVLEVQGDLNNATANMRITVDDVAIDYTWNCTAGEGIASFDLASLGAAQLGTELILEQKSAEGQFLLPADEMSLGATWEMKMESTLQFSQDVGGETIAVSGDMSTLQTNTVVGNDPVTFDGTTVDGIQLEQQDTITLDMNVLGTQVEQTVNVSNLFSMGWGIGIVQQSSTTDFGSETTNLVLAHIP